MAKYLDESDGIRQEYGYIFLARRNSVQIHDDELEAVQLGGGQVNMLLGSLDATLGVIFQEILIRVHVFTLL